MKNILVGFCALLLCVNTVIAANTDKTFKEAVGFLKAGSPDQAYNLLLKNHDSKSKNPQEFFLLGISAKESNQLADAEKYLEQLIQLDPKAARPKLELADVAGRQGKRDKAKQLLLDVKADNPPPGVIATIDRLLANLEAQGQQQKSWRVRASLGWLYDSNANAGPTVKTVELYGVPFILSTDAKETSDKAAVLRLGFDHTKAMNNTLSWQSNLSFAGTNYKTLDNLDTVSWSGSTGAAWRQNNKTIWSLPLLYNWVRIGHASSYYYYSYGVAPSLRYMSSQRLSYSLGTSITHKKYLSSNSRNTTSYSLSPSLDYRVIDKGTFRVGLTAAEDDSGLDSLSNKLYGVNLSYFHNFSKNLILTVTAGYNESKYKGIESAYTVRREDKNKRYGLDLLYRIADIESDVVFSVNHSDNKSNLPIYAHARNQVSVTLRKAY